MILQAVRAVFSDLLESVLQFLVAEMLALSEKVAEVFQYRLDRFDITRFAVDQQLVSASADVHVQKRFEIFDVLVLNAEKRVEALRRKLEFSKIVQIRQISQRKFVYIREATKSMICCQ